MIWSLPSETPSLFLTFDDGPIPEITPRVCTILAQFNAKATFFCVGDNVKKHPVEYQQLLEEGHSVGNHTYNHLNGWSSKNLSYYRNVYLKSDDWKRKRFVVLRRDNWQCVYCGARATEVHHKKYAKRNIGKEPIKWLVSVCRPCYASFHT